MSHVSFARTLTVAALGVGLALGSVALRAPRATADTRAPSPAPIALADSGADLFATNCSTCHGAKGDGDGPAAPGLNPKPRKFSDKAIMSKLTDAKLTAVIKGGGAANGLSPLMPAFGHLTDAQIKSLVTHIRGLAK